MTEKRDREGVITRARRAIAEGLAPSGATANEDELHELALEAFDSIAVIDAEGRYQRVQSRWPTLLGRSAEELVGTDPLAWLHPEDLDPIARLLAAPAPVRQSVVVRARDTEGRWTWLEITLLPRRDATRWMLARRTEAPADAAKSEPPPANAEQLTRQARRIAHQMNNLVHVIRGHLEVPQDRESERVLLRHVEESAEGAALLARQLVQLASGRTAQPRVVDVRDELGRALEAMESLVGSPLALAADEGESLRASIAPATLEMTLASLLVNVALRAGEKSQLLLRAFSCEAGDRVALQVEAREPSSVPERERHFAPLSTLPDDAAREAHGLAFVVSALEPLGGRLDAEMGDGPPRAYRIVLPRQPVEEPAPRHAAASSPPSHPEATPATNTTILIVDDSAEVRATAARILAAEGHRVLEADSGSRASEIAREQDGPIDLLLVDMILGDESGLEVNHRVAELHPRMKSLFMSGFPDILGSPPSLEEVPPRMLAKPFRSEELLSAVRERLER